MSTFVFVPKQTVLLIMRYQTDIMTLFLLAVSALLSNARALRDAARAKDVSVYFTKFRFSPGYPEVSPLDKNGQDMKQLGLFIEDRVPPELGRQPGESTIIAHRANVFYGTDLQVQLFAKGINTLIMVGVVSTDVVLSSIVHASDAGYRLFTIKNCCHNPDPVAHEHFFATAFELCTMVLSLADTLSLLR